jgi:4'-phosphopantetheinyl transferase
VNCAVGEVHAWRIELDSSALDVEKLGVRLSTDEKERANQFSPGKLRDRWIATHGALRYILACYAECEPSSLVFATTPQGKPFLAWPDTVSFNVSHSRDLALVAVANIANRVGVDVEHVRWDLEIEKISRLFFSSTEADEIMRLPAQSRINAFFASWTRKEAFLKAVGSGLHRATDSFCVTVDAEQPPRLIAVDWDEASRWCLIDVGQANMPATIALEGQINMVRHFVFAS